MVEGADIADGLGVVTKEMLDGAELLVEVVRKLLYDANMVSATVEEKLKIPAIHTDLCFGTPDVWFYVPHTGVLEVIDYKFGHRFVDEFENDQLVTYYAGILDQLVTFTGKPAGLLDQHTRVNLTVIQPRCYYRGQPVRTWSVMGSDLRGQINKLKHAAELATQPNPVAVTNKACIECPGRHACATLQRGAYGDAELAGAGDIVELDSRNASLELHLLERAQNRLESRITGLQEYLLVKAKSGDAIPFHKLEQSIGRPSWTAPVDQILALGQLMNIDLSKPGVLTPGQAKKAGIDDSVIKAYSVTTPGAIKLVSDNPANARRVFGSTSSER